MEGSIPSNAERVENQLGEKPLNENEVKEKRPSSTTCLGSLMAMSLQRKMGEGNVSVTSPIAVGCSASSGRFSKQRAQQNARGPQWKNQPRQNASSLESDEELEFNDVAWDHHVLVSLQGVAHRLLVLAVTAQGHHHP